MSSEQRFEFTKDNIDTYLKELAKEYRKLVGKNMRAELILIGGASVLVNYGFRDIFLHSFMFDDSETAIAGTMLHHIIPAIAVILYLAINRGGKPSR